MDLNEFKATVEKLDEERTKVMREHGQAALGGAFKELFDKHPKLESVTWTQYTPHFNDGDACVFSVNGFESVLYDGAQREDPCWKSEEYNKLPDALVGDLKTIQLGIKGITDAMRLTFGDHAEVTAVRGGEFKVDSYDHD
jgi:hypothetical protein